MLTGGGPVHASETMAVYMFDHGFKRFQFGYASAVAVIMLVISLVFALPTSASSCAATSRAP